MKKRCIVNPFSPIPMTMLSHVRGWAVEWGNRINADIPSKRGNIHDYDEVYIDHGVNFNGSLNLFGGFDDDVFDRCLSLVEYIELGMPVYSLDIDIDKCNYPEQIASRIGAKSTSSKLNEQFISRLRDALSRVHSLHMGDLDLPGAIIGDSHSTAFASLADSIHRENGKTLFSMMKGGLESQVKQFQDKETITFCFGSIDIRHHSMSPGKTNAVDLAKEYVSAVKNLEDVYPQKFKVCAAVPVEYEGRRIPKTGWHNGMPFNGSLEERKEITSQFNAILGESLELISPPDDWYTMDPEEYAKTKMELASSVHIRPSCYRSLEWGNV